MADTRELIRRVQEELFGKGRTELIDELIHPDFVNHTPLQGVSPDRDGLATELQILHAAASNGRGPVDDILVDGRNVAWRWRFLGTHTGEFMGIPPSGNKLEITGIDLGVVRDDKLAEWWSEVNMLDVMTQLGAMEQPPG
jgi:predicted ester cyclase